MGGASASGLVLLPEPSRRSRTSIPTEGQPQISLCLGVVPPLVLYGVMDMGLVHCLLPPIAVIGASSVMVCRRTRSGWLVGVMSDAGGVTDKHAPPVSFALSQLCASVVSFSLLCLRLSLQSTTESNWE